MASIEKSVKFGDVDGVDTALIYSHVIAIQLSLESLTMNDILKYELAAIPTAMFVESGDVWIAKIKSVLKNKMNTEVSA